MSRLITHIRKWKDALRKDIFLFAQHMGVTPTWQQAQLFDIVQKETHPPPGFKRKGRIAVKSGQGPGKTLAAVVVGGWRTFQAEGAMTMVTAPSMRQCRDVYLTEFLRNMNNASEELKALIDVRPTRVLYNDSPEWAIRTVTAKDEVNAQGYHEKHMTWIVEEASGVARKFVDQIKGTLSNQNELLLMIGNPNTNDCAFHDCFSTHLDEWHTLTFNAEETARDYPQILNPERNMKLDREYGRDSDVYRVRVLGEFPHSDPGCVMSPEDLAACTRTNKDAMMRQPIIPGERIKKSLGIDLARFGSDESVIAKRMGRAIVFMRTFAKREPVEVLENAMLIQKDSCWSDKDCKYVVDVTGLGGGSVIVLHRARKDVYEFNNGSTAFDGLQFANKITEAYFFLRSLVMERNCYLPNDSRLLQQLGTRQYHFKKGQIILETKEEYKDRGYESPDRGDAVAMAFYDSCFSVPNVAVQGKGSRRIGIEVH